MLDWLRLVRLPNHATAVADTLAGYLIVSQASTLDWPPAACWLAIAASLVAGLLPAWRACQVAPAIQLKSQ